MAVTTNTSIVASGSIRGWAAAVMTWVLVVGVPASAASQEQEGEGEAPKSPEVVIADVEMTCDIEQCDNPVNVEKYLDIAGLYAGRLFSEETLEVARTRLQKTGLFESITFESTRISEDSVSLSVEAIGARRIRDIDFVKVDPPPFRSDLQKLLIYRRGEPYEGRLSKKNTQLASLESEFERQGYFGTDIELIVRPVPDERKLVDIIFKVEKGQSLDICEIGVRGLEAMTYSEARANLLAGVSFFARRLELVAPRFTTAALEEGQETLVRNYRKLGYFQARIVETSVQKSFDDECVTILADVSEGPHWELLFEGNDVFDSDDLRDELPFFESGYVDAEEIERAERAIRQLYETRGYPFARVEGTEVREDRLHRSLQFQIEEGPRLEIDAVRFHGNRVLSNRQLSEGLGTRPFQLFESGGFLQTEQLLSDFRKIEAKYRERGYLRAVVERFELRVDQAGDDIVVHVHIDEGTKTVASEVRFNGVRSLSRSRLRNRVEIRAGDPFVPVQVRADASRMVQLYSSVGYPLAETETECQRLTGEQVPCERPKLPAGCLATSTEAIEKRCSWKSEQKRRYVCRRLADDCQFEGGIGESSEIRVNHYVDEGPLVTTGELLVQGNFRTRDSVLYRELPIATGEIFDVRQILKAQSNLRSLGIFDSVSIEAIGLDEAARKTREQQAALVVSVEEGQNRFFELNFGLEGRDLLGERRRLLTTGEVRYTDRNLLGYALELEPRVFAAADLIQVGDYVVTGLSPEAETGRIDYLVGAELAFENPRFLKRPLGVEKLSLTVTPFYIIDLLGVTNDQLLREEWGLALEVRKELSEILERFFVSLGLEGKQSATAPIDGPRLDGERIFSPRRITGKLIPEMTLDRRDSPLNPTKGFFTRLRPEIVSGDALSAEVDTIDDSYLRLTWTGAIYFPLWKPLVLAQNVRYGHVLPFFGRETRIPADERYFLGGAGSIRGYANNTLGPTLNDQPSGGEFTLNYNFELRFPLIRGANLRGATFFDTGLLVDCFDDDAPTERTGCYDDAFGDDLSTNIRSSAGVGLRYVIADQIPLLFDYGVALDRRANEGIGALQFHLGYTF